MLFPEIISYLLTLKYPGSESAKQNWVCYRGGYQVRVIIPTGITIRYISRPLEGLHARLEYATRFGSDMVPNVFSGTITQYGSTTYNGVVTERVIADALEYFNLVTEQEPTRVSITNLSPLAQYMEAITDYIAIPSSEDLAIVMDALRRLNTSEKAEHLLEVLSGEIPQGGR